MYADMQAQQGAEGAAGADAGGKPADDDIIDAEVKEKN
jgi:hypothetical protein